jgi:hypothetical protein
VIARGTPGFSGADLANLVNEAALLAARKGKRLVAMQEFEEAKDKVLMGTERKLDGHDRGRKAMTAYHEAGPRDRRAARAGVRPDPQGDDHSRAAGRWAWSCACPSGTITATTATRCTRTSRSRWAAVSPRS